MSPGICPRISVIIPAYNVEDLIPKAIESVLAQTVPPHEVIVVDDGSTDGTSEVVNQYSNVVRYFWQENAGPSVARNTGIHEATGDWIAFVDSDDYWLPGKIEAEIRVLDSDPELAWVASNHDLRVFGTDESFLRFDTSRIPAGFLEGQVLPSFVEAAALGLGWDPVGLLIRKDVLIGAGGFRAGLNYGEDLDLCLSICWKYPKLGFVPEPVAVHHVGRAEGLCEAQPILQHLRVLRSIYERHVQDAEVQGWSREFRTIFRTVVQDQIAMLLQEGRLLSMWKALSLYQDIVTGRYLRTMVALGFLPSGLRNGIYEKSQWRIRALGDDAS